MDKFKIFSAALAGTIATGFVVWSLIPKLYRKMITSVIDLLYILLQVKIHSVRNHGKTFSYANVFESAVDKHPDRIQFISVEDEHEYKLSEMDVLANQISWWLQGMGVSQKDVVALMMLNRPEFVIFWLGCAKVGVTCSLVNTNSTGKTFLHAANLSFEKSNAKILVIDAELKDQVINEIKELEANGVKVFYWNPDFINFMIKTQSPKRPPATSRSLIKERDPMMLIFTSGTTGLPKASNISHSRFIVGSWPYVVLGKITAKDRIYNTMPLYHSAAGMLGIGTAIRSGACMVLRRKFSVKSFAADCVKFRCTSMQYIGELCRYLLSSPPSECENQLSLRSAFGNGMRPDVWAAFQERFHIKNIIEFYASTEGNLGLFNSTNKVGALGYVPRMADTIYPVTLVKADPEDQSMPYRDPKGFCVKCKPNEPGLLIAPIDNRRVDRRFDGYTDSSATTKKILKDVFGKGDVFFNTGDLLTRDELGFYYWSDRVGDTFRWKGENVATSEIEGILCSCPGIEDNTVYGVNVPGYDGKAGMAAIVLKQGITPDTVDWQGIISYLSTHLPTYSRPAFFRIQKQLATTSTYKHLKADLVKEGFDLDNVKGDPIFFHSAREKKIVPLTKSLFDDIIKGKAQV